MTKLYPVLLFFFMLASGAVAQTPADNPAKRDSVIADRHIADTLKPGGGRLKRKIPNTRADSVGIHRAFADSGRTRKVFADSGGIRRAFADSGRIRRASADSGRIRKNIADSGRAVFFTDSLRYSNTNPGLRSMPGEWMALLASNAYLNFPGKPVRVREEKYQVKSYDALFYLLVGMLFFFAIVKLAFGRYLSNLLTLFFRVSMRQQQIRDQVIQSPFPSIMLNLLFVLSAGLYASFLLQFYGYAGDGQFWSYFLYSALALTFIYLVKFLFLQITGWIFNIKKAVETYGFIVFMTNKIIGIFLLPFLVILSFSSHLIALICVTASLAMIGIFYFYRIVASFKSLRKEINISGLHFFLYLCAFEIAPLLLIYKVLLTYLEKAN